MRRLVLDLADSRPIFQLPEQAVNAIRSGLPEGWEVAVVKAPAVGTGDGGGRASAAALEAVRDAEAYCGFGVPAEILRAGPALRWVHSGAAGVAGSLTPEMLARQDVVFTNSAGIHGPPVAETVLGFILHFARGLDLAVRAQARREWRTVDFDAADSPVRELSRSTVGVVGFGGIGREVAWRVEALGARVLATRRSAATGADRGAATDAAGGDDGGGGAREAAVEILTGPDRLARLLEASHYVVLSLPETPETRGLIDRDALARMRRDAVLINVARGGLVDEAALAASLEKGEIRGAALDVFRTEPLPPEHPLWMAPRVLITPHTSGYTHTFWAREAELISENLRRYARGARLRNVVDKRAGY